METLHQPDDIIALRYRIVTALGQGAFGTTYEAEDLTNYQRVAIKALSLRQLRGWKVLEFFEREARVLANLNHPGIPKYLDYFHEDTAEDRQFYLVQELVSGESLADLVKKGWHSHEDEVKQVALQVLEILNYLHQLKPSVIHRDIKPQNIIRRSDGQIFLVDFGAVQDVYRNTLIQKGTFVGTLGYMPPEQLRGQAFFASDLYALGATLLFLLTHRSPADLPQRRMKIDFRERVQLSPAFADWLEKMVEPAVEDRFKSAIEALAALQGKRAIPRLTVPIYEKPFMLRRRQPKGSRIVFNKTNQRLLVKIPPIGLTSQTGFLALFILFWSGFTWFMTSVLSAVFAGNLLALLLVTSPFWMGLVLSLWGLVFTIAGSSYLEIDSQTFRIGWTCLGLSQQIKGRIADIKRIELDVTSKARETTTSPAICEGKRKHHFAAEVTPVEKEWLVAEITDFLEYIRSDRV